jgi:septal ring factor EnvC (AmiA/AmiB activator)
MTYLFILIGLSVINALANKKISWAELVFTNLVLVFLVYGLEKLWLLKHESSKQITYEKIDMIQPQKRAELKKDLEEKKKIAKRLENELTRIIEEERKKSKVTELTPEQRLIGENFMDNRGRLPWPVERGVITSHFGTHQHPILKYVTEKNDGVDITSSVKTKARSVFKGEVTAISAIEGANMTVIIKHGKYLSLYHNLVNVKVKKGELIETKQEIGDVFSDPKENNSCTLKFMIFEQKFLDPEIWITKM